ncbi:MAG: RNA methyltransferase [Bacteroidetes bacterium]|nr:RNA methyltransferase [Bacteroidota bacterium]
MITKNQIKHIRSLQQLKFRKAFNEFVVEGEKIVKEIIDSKYRVSTLFALEEWINENQQSLTLADILYEKVSPKELARISSLKSPNKVLAVVKISGISAEIQFDNLVLVLDNIQDPGNLGTIIRTADWFGIQDIVCSNDCVDLYNPKVLQSTMGSFTRVNVFYHDLIRFLKERVPADVVVYGSFLDGKNIYKTDLKKSGLIIIGNESKGISEEVANVVHKRILVPAIAQNGSSNTESLNASVATGIILNEFTRNL